ncbi:hypothetical protein KPH14_005505 [Odynerus spinipes]|uniref:DUF4773 domain-containing protein n=1 Tax=Odynerus spinipes TaxID=1348599 RepID=A0AAD9RC30_9HYME|nr:hypothetical protein KPH14_005505 [Odynerus spinipes]
MSRSFLVYKTNSISGRSCTCSTSFSCSCCENVIIFYTKARKQLCVNFTYQTDGLNVNITLESRVIKDRTVTEYKPFKICSPVPGSFFSSVCANVLELNQFPRSITACLRTEITTKHKLWELTYNCISISTELPMMSDDTADDSMMTESTTPLSGMSSGEMPGMTSMPPGQMPGMPSGQMSAMPGMPSMPSGQMPGMSSMPSGQMPGMPGMPSMPSGQMPGMPSMPSGQMPEMPSMPPGQMSGGMRPMPPGQMSGGMQPMPPGQMSGGMQPMPPGQMPGGMPPMPPGQMPGNMPSMAPALPAL